MSEDAAAVSEACLSYEIFILMPPFLSLVVLVSPSLSHTLRRLGS